MESIGDIIVSISPFHEKTVMSTALLKDSSISSLVIPESLDFLHLSDLLMALFIIVSSSSSSKSKNGAVDNVSF